MLHILKYTDQASGVARWVSRELCTLYKPNDLSLTPGAHVDRELTPNSCPLATTQIRSCVLTH